jgi:hypothetical protein
VIFRAQFACSILVYVAAAACPPAPAQSTAPPNENIIAEMTQARALNRTHFRPYIVSRDYKLFEGADHTQAKSRVMAEITVVPPEFKKYAIENTNGSGLGEKIVRKVLDGEVAVARDSSSTDITRDNYDFLFVREEELNGQRCYVLELMPRRKSKNLLHGTIWVDANTYLPHRVEGEPSRTPSWWLKDVHVVLLYGYVGGMWIQTSSQATANVRILGQSTMVSQDLRYQIDDLTADTTMAHTTISVGDQSGK